MKTRDDGRMLKRLYFILMWLCVLAAAGGLLANDLPKLLTGQRADNPAADDKVIATVTTAQDDRNIQRRLQEIFSELENLKTVTIEVSNGVVTLEGELGSVADENKALKLAQQVEGVVDVVNKMTIHRGLEKRLQRTGQKILNLGKELMTSLPLFMLALAVFVLFWLMGGWITRRRDLFLRISPNFFIAGLIGQIIHLAAITLGLVLALVMLDATALLGTILGAAGIAGLAVGFAVRDTVENYIASILLSVRNPFEVNDLVNIDGHEGNVAKLNSRATILISLDGNHIRIPNAIVFKTVIVNYTRNPLRRFRFDIGVDPGQELLATQALALETLKGVTGVLADPKPMVVIDGLGDSNVVLSIFGWVDQNHHSFPKVRSEAIRQVKEAFDHAGIVMPEPMVRVRVVQAVTAPAAEPRESIRADSTEIRDVSADRPTERKGIEDQGETDGENLLSADAPKEL